MMKNKQRHTIVLSTANYGNNRARHDYNDLEVKKKERDDYRRMKLDIKQKDSIEFWCKRGQVQTINQDSIFIDISEDYKIFGLFDGHGPYGHKVSSY